MRVTLTFPWHGPSGARHRKGTTVTVDRATGRSLVRGGRARAADDSSAAEAEPTSSRPDPVPENTDPEPGTPADGKD